jgi:hypothetical protein
MQRELGLDIATLMERMSGVERIQQADLMQRARLLSDDD